jgi:hypothetical protein
MAYHTRMADLTMRDMQRLHLTGQRLMALANALNSTGLQGKPALLQLLGEINADIETIFRKGVRGLANHLRRGKAPRGNDDPEFCAHIVAVMEAEAARLQPSPAPSEALGADGGAPIGASESRAPEMGTVGTEPTLAAVSAPESGA